MKKYKVGTVNIPYKRMFLISDVHFGVRSNSLEWLDNQADFFYEFYIPFLKENAKEGDVLFMLGDWFDNRQLLDILIMNTSIDIVTEMAKILPLHMITGNHDIYKKQDTDVNSLRAFESIDNVTIYTDPVNVTNGNSKILVLPWVGDKTMEEEYGKANPADYIFAHTDLSGFKYDNNMRITNGAQLMNIKKAKRIISGHIHKRQEMEHSRGIYIGSPYSTKRSDIGNTKGVYVFTPDTNEIEFYENTQSPIFQRLRLEDLMEMTLEDAFTLLDNNYTDIIVPDKYIHIFNLTRFIELIKGCQYKTIETKGERTGIEDTVLGLIDGEEIKDILTLLTMTIDDTAHSAGTLNVLKERNKTYYYQARNIEETENI